MKKLFKFAVFAAFVAAVIKVMAAQKEEWSGLSEAELRNKLSDKLGAKVPEEKLQVIQDQAVSAMRGKGMLREDAADPVVDEE